MPPKPIQLKTTLYLEEVESALQQAVQRANEFGYSRLYEMLAYHMGWTSDQAENALRGKRMRPLIVLLSCQAAGGEWKNALPAATAVELVHNFSLIHDDIEDNSPLRRGRPTLWKKWGIPQAINCGDALFALAHLEATRLSETAAPTVAIQAVELLQATCLHLTQGQYLDLSYETRKDVTIEDYWRMVEGKTAALIAASAELGCLAAFGDEPTSLLYRKFGHALGMAFQVQDDWLGIWGDANLTGKSSHSDLATGKITLPVLFGVSQGGTFAERWLHGTFTPQEVPSAIKLLEVEGGREYTEMQARHFIEEAMASLEQAHPDSQAGEALVDLAMGLLNRRK